MGKKSWNNSFGEEGEWDRRYRLSNPPLTQKSVRELKEFTKTTSEYAKASEEAPTEAIKRRARLKQENWVKHAAEVSGKNYSMWKSPGTLNRAALRNGGEVTQLEGFEGRSENWGMRNYGSIKLLLHFLRSMRETQKVVGEWRVARQSIANGLC